MNRGTIALDIVALGLCIYIGVVVVGTATNPTYQRGLSERYSEQQRTKRVQEEQWGDTLRTWGMWGAGALGVAVVTGAAGWTVIQWQRERTKRHVVSAQASICLAYIAQFGGRMITHEGMDGVLLNGPDGREFVPWHIARRELAQARLLTVDSEYSGGG